MEHGQRAADLPEVCAWFFTHGQKQLRVSACQELLDEITKDQNILSRVITGEATRVYC